MAATAAGAVVLACAAASVHGAGEGDTGGEPVTGASPAPFDPEAPFRGLEWVRKSGDGRGVYLQLRTHDAVPRLPGHAGTHRMPPRESAALLIACRIPGPPDSLGPDDGYTCGVLVAPDHPSQPDAWRWFDPRGWVAHLLGFAVRRWPVEVQGPGGHVEAGTLERERATYDRTRPGLQVRFPPHATIRWLAGRTAKERFAMEVRGDDIAMTLTLESWPGQAEALERMALLCPGVQARAGAAPGRRAASPEERQDCDRPGGSAKHSTRRDKASDTAGPRHIGEGVCPGRRPLAAKATVWGAVSGRGPRRQPARYCAQDSISERRFSKRSLRA